MTPPPTITTSNFLDILKPSFSQLVSLDCYILAAWLVHPALPPDSFDPQPNLMECIEV
jgi:hypothetical protein